MKRCCIIIPNIRINHKVSQSELETCTDTNTHMETLTHSLTYTHPSIHPFTHTPTHPHIHTVMYIGAWWSYLTLPVPQLLGHPCKTCHCNSLGKPPGSAISAALCCGALHPPALCGPWKGKSEAGDLKLRIS